MQDPNNQNYILSIKQQQAIEQILNQTSNQPEQKIQELSSYQLDIDIEQMLKQSQRNIYEEYETMAQRKFRKNREAVSIDNHKQLEEIMNWEKNINNYAVMEDNQQCDIIWDARASKFQVESDVDNRKYSTDTFIDYGVGGDLEVSDDSQDLASQKNNQQQILQYHQYILQKLERQKLMRNNKQEQEQILKLDQKYPKINPLPMLKHQYPIFKFTQSTSNKYLKHFRYSLQDICAATTIQFNNQIKWTIIAIGQQMLVFPKQNWKQPIIYVPQKYKNITHMVVSPQKKYLAIALTDQIVVYTIKKDDGLILLKHFCQLNLVNITKIQIYQDSPIRLVYIDQQELVGTITIDKTLIFTRVSNNNIQHDLDIVLDMDVLVLPNGTNILALASRQQIGLFTLQPYFSTLQTTKIRQRTAKDIQIRWRNNFQLKKPQLFVSFNNKVEIYKMSVPSGSLESEAKQLLAQLLNLGSEQILIPHLIYLNHYDIVEMQIISQTHLLLRSHQNIIVIAIPLIPSSMELDNDQTQQVSQIFETAIVFISQQRRCRLLNTNFNQIMFYSDKFPQILRIASLKTLNMYLDELMLHNSCYRQAFILLILIHKGVNFSFKFSYTNQELKNCIYSAIQCTLSSILKSMERQIIQFKVGWICQVAIQTKNQNILWSSVYRKLKQKKHLEILFDLLQLFVLRDQITSMPQQVFFAFIGYQCGLGKDLIVQKIILNNSEQYDGSRLIGLIHNKQRYYLQFFLFTKSIISDEADFYTPFIKVFSAFQQSYQHKNFQKSYQTGMLCFWYIRKCFLFQQIPHGYMTLQQKLNIIFNLYIQIMQPTFTKKLADFNFKIFLQTYLITFIRSQFNVLVEQNAFILLQKYHQYFPGIEQKYNDEISEIDAVKKQNKKTFNFHEIMLNHLRKSINIKTDPILWNQFTSITFYYTRCYLSFDTVIDVLGIFFQNKITDLQLELPDGMYKPTLEEVQTELILYIKPKLLQKKDRFYMNKLLSFSDPNINHLLHRIDQNYKLALQHFLSTKPTQKLIPFIYQLIADIEKLTNNQQKQKKQNKYGSSAKSFKEKKTEDLKEFLVKNINLLFKIDRNQALNIFYAIGETCQSIYAHIEQHMAEKLNFLTAVLEKFQQQDFQSKQTFLLDHLAEVCSLKDAQMLKYLNQFYYPLDKAISVCQQKNNLLAKAIFQERSGQITDAFISYQRLVRNLIMNKNVPEKRIRKKVNKYIEQCIRLCKMFSGDNSSQNFWLRIILFINGFIKSNHQQKVFLKVEFERMLQLVLHQMFDFLPTTLLIDFFISKSYKLELSISKEFSIYSNLFVLIRFDISLAVRVIDICKLDVKGNRKQTLKKRKNAIISKAMCDFCQNNLQEQQKSNVYLCGHSFHTICHDDTNKCLTCYYQSDTSIFTNNIFGQKIRRSSLDYSEYQNQDEQTERKKRKKLKIDAKNIYVENAYAATLESRRKKMKLFDYKSEQINNFMLNIDFDKQVL